MKNGIEILRAGPLATIQDQGRAGHLSNGISASGPMDRQGYAQAGHLAQSGASSGIEFTMAGLSFVAHGGALKAGFAGGHFNLTINGKPQNWPSASILFDGDIINITPGTAGNYGYVRFSAEIDVPTILNSRATNLIVGLGGYQGRALKKGDFVALADTPPEQHTTGEAPAIDANAPIRFLWGLHAETFPTKARQRFIAEPFKISPMLDRMGVRLADPQGVLADIQVLSLVSDAIMPGDIQILGDGTPIVLMRDHQPTGGYPRIGTVISADIDRFAQLRPGTEIRFTPVTITTAQSLLRQRVTR